MSNNEMVSIHAHPFPKLIKMLENGKQITGQLKDQQMMDELEEQFIQFGKEKGVSEERIDTWRSTDVSSDFIKLYAYLR